MPLHECTLLYFEFLAHEHVRVHLEALQLAQLGRDAPFKVIVPQAQLLPWRMVGGYQPRIQPH